MTLSQQSIAVSRASRLPPSILSPIVVVSLLRKAFEACISTNLLAQAAAPLGLLLSQFREPMLLPATGMMDSSSTMPR
jgi:hypothetical protein